MPGKFTREAKFWGFDGVSKIRLYANQGKNGYNLGTTIKMPNERATTGMQITFQTEEEANKEFDRRVEDTAKKGYAPRGSGNGMIGRRSRFADLPTEPEWGRMVPGSPSGTNATVSDSSQAGTRPSMTERMSTPPRTQEEVEKRVEEAQTHQEQPPQLRAAQEERQEEQREAAEQTSGEADNRSADSVEEVEQVVAHGNERGSKGSRRR